MRALQLTVLACGFGILGGCGPDDRPHDRCRLEPTFIVSIVPEEGSVFPNDTRVTFEYGGTREIYEFDQPRTPKVVFCESRAAESGEGGAGGSASGPRSGLEAGDGGERSSAGVGAILCELWTAGSTDVDVQASGFGPIEERQRLLQREDDTCTVQKTLVVPRLDPEDQPRE